jgi:predicted NBD/HSP70 family sugar kinase
MARPKKPELDEGSELAPDLAWLAAGKRITKPAYNRLLVCSTLFREGPESRMGLHERTGIPLSRLSEICSELIRAGLVREGFVAPAGGGGRGRPQTRLEIDLRRLGVACVRYDSDQVTAAVVDLTGIILWQRRWEGPFGGGAVRLLRRVGSAARLAVEAGPKAGIRMLAVGAADPGMVDVASGRAVRAVNVQGWEDVPVVAELRRITGYPAVIERGDGWQALGEVAFGAGRGAEHAVFVTLLEGIGGGIVESGRLLQGRDGSVGEIGHTRVSDDGPACGCGGSGCLEAHLAPARLAALWRGTVPKPVSRATPRGGAPNDDFARMLQAARTGDAHASQVLAAAALALARGLGNVVSLLNPERIILGGRFVEAGDLFLEPLNRALPRYALRESLQGVQVRLAELGDSSTFLGIAAHFRDRIFAYPSVGVRMEQFDGTGDRTTPIQEAAS